MDRNREKEDKFIRELEEETEEFTPAVEKLIRRYNRAIWALQKVVERREENVKNVVRDLNFTLAQITHEELAEFDTLSKNQKAALKKASDRCIDLTLQIEPLLDRIAKISETLRYYHTEEFQCL